MEVKMEEEKVLCIRKNNLPAEWFNKNDIIPMSWSDFIDICSSAGFNFVPRSAVENNPNWKQVITQVVLQTNDLSKIAIHRMDGDEKRLHGLWSTGIGGHINKNDLSLPALGHKTTIFEETLKTGMMRELNEELVERPAQDKPVFCGVISFNGDVGKYHLGILFRMLTDKPAAYVPGQELSSFRWASTDILDGFDFDIWSIISMNTCKNKGVKNEN